MQRFLALAMLGSVSGCSWLYNPNNLSDPPPEAGIDAPSDAEVILDADPSMLQLLEVSPKTIFEGQGDGGSAPALIVVGGHNIISNNTTVEVTAADGSTPMIEVGAPTIAINGNWIAFPVTARVDPALAQTARIALDVKVTETDPMTGAVISRTLSDLLGLQGLDEYIPTTATATLNIVDIRDRYSKIDTTASALSFAGTGRALLRATSSIAVGKITANGASGAAGGAAAVGGCAGGSPASTGGCDGTIGGKGGTDGGVLGGAGGGGGGGFTDNGGSGTGNGAGAAGSRTGDELIVTYNGYGNHSANLSAGGGGGGKPTLSPNGGIGGAGGGSIELTAGGNLTVAGAISVNGGAGQSVSGSTGGGGGAGGLVMLRTDGALSIASAISIAGGAAGTGGSGNGGAGSRGRVRWDAAEVTGIAPTIAAPTPAGGALHRGPAFTMPTRVFRTPKAKLSINGTANDRFTLYTINGGTTTTGAQVTLGPDGTAEPTITLQQGHSALCLTLEGGQPGTPEADKCIDVAFLP